MKKDYLYINAAIKAKTTQIFNQKQYQILKDTNKEDYIKVLNDLAYGLTVTKSIDEIAIQENEKILKDLKMWLDFDDIFLKCYLFTHDLINIKIMYKSRVFNVPLNNEFDNLGNYSHEFLYAAIFNKDYTYVNEDKELFEIIESKIDNLDPKELSDMITIELYAYLYQKYFINKNDIFENFYKLTATLKNILVLFRSIRLNESLENFMSSLLKYSYFDLDVLKDVFLKKDFQILKGLDKYLPMSFELIFKNLEENYKISDIENLCNKVLLDNLKIYNCDVDYVGPLIVYVMNKKFEMKNVKMLYFDKSVSLDDLLIM